MEEARETKRRRRRKGFCLAGLAVCALSFGATWAWYTGGTALANPLGTSHSGAAMIEEFDPNSTFLPGETVTKKVAFQNTGDMDVFLRVEVPPEEGWYEKNHPNKKLEDLETGQVEKIYSKDIWAGYGAEDDENETAYWSRVWTANGKSYRYYRKVLGPGETTELILDAVKLKPEVSNDRHAPDYSDKIYRLSFQAEAVPVEGNDAGDGSLDPVQAGAGSEWGMQVSGTKDALDWVPESGNTNS